MVKRFLLIPLMVVLAGALIFGGCAAPAPAPAPVAPAPGPEPTAIPTPVAPAPAPAPAPELPNQLIWGNRGTVGDYYIQAVGFIKVVDKYTPIRVIFRETAGVPATMPLMRKGEVNIYGASLRDLDLAYTGTAEMKELGKTDIRLILGGNTMPIGYFTMPHTGITKIEDIAGKKVSYTSSRALIFNEVGAAILEYYGLLDKIEDIPMLAKQEKKSGLIEGALDISLEGFFGGSMVELSSTMGVVPLVLSEECIEYVHEKCPYIGVVTVTLPAGYGQPIGTKIKTVAAVGGVIVRADMSNDTVRAILEAIYDHYDELLPIHAVFDGTVLERATTLSATVPYHPEAVKYYREKGVWSSEVEALQKKLLAAQ